MARSKVRGEGGGRGSSCEVPAGFSVGAASEIAAAIRGTTLIRCPRSAGVVIAAAGAPPEIIGRVVAVLRKRARAVGGGCAVVSLVAAAWCLSRWC